MNLKSAVTVSLVPEAQGGPFVFWHDLPGACRRAAELGFNAVEVFPRSPGDLNPQTVRQWLADHQLDLAAVGTGAGWVAHRLRLTDSDPKIRQAAREFVTQMIDFAGELKAPAIIGSMQGRWEGETTRTQALGWLGEALAVLAGRAAKYGLPLLFEPLNRYETNVLNQATDAFQFVESLDAPNLRLLCDLFHLNIEEQDIAGSLRAVAPRLGHIHFVDSNRRAVGWGHTAMQPVIETLRAINYRGYLSAEILPWPDSDAAASQAIKAYRQLTAPSGRPHA